MTATTPHPNDKRYIVMPTNEFKTQRVAWLYPQTMSGANYIQPLLREFSQIYPNTRFFTGEWKGYTPGCEEAFLVEVVGKHSFLKFGNVDEGYGAGIHLVSLGIVKKLLSFNPNVIFINGLGLWTLVVVFLKPIKQWKIVQIYSGSSPSVDFVNSWPRTFLRKLMARSFDAVITNSQAGKNYLTKILEIPENLIHTRPYQIPDKQAMTSNRDLDDMNFSALKKPVFLCVGQLINRKGVQQLLESCKLLRSRNICQYSLVIVGKGDQYEYLQNLASEYELDSQITWAGYVPYGKLGLFFENSDALIFPTLEDIWGMVVLEAMLFSKPVLCSDKAGARELIIEGGNGYLFDPCIPSTLAHKMELIIRDPEIIINPGAEIVSDTTPQLSAERLSRIVQNLFD